MRPHAKTAALVCAASLLIAASAASSEGSSRLGYIQLDRIEGVARRGAIVRIRTQRSERAGAS